MTNKTFHIPDSRFSDFVLYLDLAQKTFEKDGNKWTLGRTLARVMEEWSKANHRIRTTSQDKRETTMIQFYSEPDWKEHIKRLFINYVHGSPGAGRELWDICLHIDSDFKPLESDPSAEIINFLKDKLQINVE